MPIYWGNPKISEEFNTNSFVNFYDFNNMNDMVEYIIELDKNNDLYIQKLKEYWFVNNVVPTNNKIENIKSFLYKIFNN
jgi:hypothetical protein